MRVWWLDTSVANVPQLRSEGTVAATDAASLDLDTRDGRRRLGRPQVTRVDVVLQEKTADPLWNGALIGGGIGAAFGGFLLSGVAESSDADSGQPLLFLMTTAAGTAVGALVDSLIQRPEYRTVYRVERPRR